MRGVATLVIAAVLTAAAAASADETVPVERRPIPSWVVELDPRPDEVPPAEAGVEVRTLLADNQLRVPSRGRAGVERFFRMVYTIDDRAALDSWSTWEIDFEPTFQTLALNRLAVYRDGEWSDRLERSRRSVLHRQEDLHAQIFDQTRTLFLIIDDLRPGDLVDIAYTLRGANPILGDRYATSYSMGAFLPTERNHLRWLLAADRPWTYKTFGGLAEPDAVGERDGMTEIVWDLENPPLSEFEYDVPPDESLQPWVQLTDYESWEQVIDWALPYYRVRGVPAELDALVADWRRQGLSGEEQVLRARLWVQENIRYFAVVVGEHSHRPHDLDEIARRRYGDCKDKTLTLLALLSRIGVDAWPVTVNTGWENGIETWLPSPWAFDHVIVGLELDGAPHWIDPTLSPQSGLSLADNYLPRYRSGLPIRPTATGLVEIPVDLAHPGVQSVTFDYRLSDNRSTYEVEVETVRTGRKADWFRQEIASTTLDDLLDSYLDYYGGMAKTLEADPLEVEDDPEDNRVLVRERYTVGLEGDVLNNFETLPLEIGAFLDLPEDLERTKPITLPYPLEHRESITLRVPADLELEPIEESIDNPWFEFEATSTVDTGRIKIDYFLATKTDRVAAEDLEPYAEDVDRFYGSLGYLIGNFPGERTFALVAALVALILSATAVGLGARWARAAT